MIDIYKLLHKMSLLNKWLRQKEGEARNEFGFELRLCFYAADNEHCIDAICRLVSEVLNVPMNKMLSIERWVHIAEARHIAVYLCQKYIQGIKHQEIASYLNRDRTTIISSLERVRDLVASGDQKLIEKISSCETELQNRINNSV